MLIVAAVVIALLLVVWAVSSAWNAIEDRYDRGPEDPDQLIGASHDTPTDQLEVILRELVALRREVRDLEERVEGMEGRVAGMEDEERR